MKTASRSMQVQKAESRPLLEPQGTDLEQTALNMINCFIGAGILTVPFAFRLSGYGAVAGLALVGALNWLTSLLLGRSLDKAAQLKPDVPASQWDFGQLALVSFGPVAKWLISALFALELWFAMETFLVLTGINGSIVTGLSRRTVIIAAGFLGMLSLSLPMRAIAGLSFLSVWCMVGGLVALVMCGSHNTAHVDHKLLDVNSMISSVGIFLYCFSGLPCLPGIRAGMRKPREEYAGAVHSAFAFSVLYYAAVGLLGYYFYGSAIRESFTENLGQGNAERTVLACRVGALMSAGLFAAKLQAGFPLYTGPVLRALGVGDGDDWECYAGLWLCRLVFVAGSVAFALVAQGALGALAELMGAFLTNFTSIIFPCAAYMAVSRAAGERLGPARVASLLTLIALGVVFGIAGTCSACSKFWKERTALF